MVRFDECFEYAHGHLTWKTRPLSHFKNARGMNSFNARFAGEVAGCLHKGTGYIHIDVFGMKSKAHRIIFHMHNGRFPAETDHINGDKADNRIENLREVTHTENMHNRPIPITNTSGMQGVHFNKKLSKWTAYITSAGIHTHLGVFHDWFEAVCARKSAEVKLGFHLNHGRTA